MELETGVKLEVRKKSWLTLRREKREFSRLKLRIHRLADEELVQQVVFEQLGASHTAYDRKTDKISHIAEGQEIHVYDDLPSWRYFTPQLEEAIKKEGEDVRKHAEEIHLYELEQYHNLYNRE